MCVHREVQYPTLPPVCLNQRSLKHNLDKFFSPQNTFVHDAPSSAVSTSMGVEHNIAEAIAKLVNYQKLDPLLQKLCCFLVMVKDGDKRQSIVFKPGLPLILELDPPQWASTWVQTCCDAEQVIYRVPPLLLWLLITLLLNLHLSHFSNQQKQKISALTLPRCVEIPRFSSIWLVVAVQFCILCRLCGLTILKAAKQDRQERFQSSHL